MWRLVEGLDLGPLYTGIKSVERHQGHPAADRKILVALWLNATLRVARAPAQARSWQAGILSGFVPLRECCGNSGNVAEWPARSCAPAADRRHGHSG